MGFLAASIERIRKGCGLFSRIVRRNKDGFPLINLSGIGAVGLRTVKASLPKREAYVKNVGSLAALFGGIREDFRLLACQVSGLLASEP